MPDPADVNPDQQSPEDVCMCGHRRDEHGVVVDGVSSDPICEVHPCMCMLFRLVDRAP